MARPVDVPIWQQWVLNAEPEQKSNLVHFSGPHMTVHLLFKHWCMLELHHVSASVHLVKTVIDVIIMIFQKNSLTS